MAYAIDWRSGVALRELLNRLAREGQAEPGAWQPAVDIYETPEQVVVAMELAGVRQADLAITIEGEVVTIAGHRDPACCAGGRARFHRMEIASGRFARSFRVTVPFDPAGARAQLEEGMLFLELPKRQTVAHRIPVREG